jgi:hypothetical protein
MDRFRRLMDAIGPNEAESLTVAAKDGRSFSWVNDGSEEGRVKENAPGCRKVHECGGHVMLAIGGPMMGTKYLCPDYEEGRGIDLGDLLPHGAYTNDRVNQKYRIRVVVEVEKVEDVS